MKLSAKPELLKIFTLAAGLLGLALRSVLYATGLDEKGLLVSGHWAGAALWVLTGLAVGGLFLLTRGIQGPEGYSDSRPASVLAGLGALALGAGILLTVFSEFAEFSSTARLIAWVLGLCTGLCMIWIGICRFRGKNPGFLCHGLLCALIAMRMVTQYQNWNSDPQLMDYVFYLGALVALMLAAYQQAAFDADMGSHRNLWCLNLIAAYLCLVSLGDAGDTWILLGGAVWAVTNLTTLKVRPRRQRPELKLEEE